MPVISRLRLDLRELGLIVGPRIERVGAELAAPDRNAADQVRDRRHPLVLLRDGLVHARARLNESARPEVVTHFDAALMGAAVDVRVVGVDVAEAIPEHAGFDR